MSSIRTVKLFICLAIVLSACSQPATKQTFQLIILDSDWYSIGLGYESEEAFSVLQEAVTEASFFTITTQDVEYYDWDAQVIGLTGIATEALAAALDDTEQGDAPEALMDLRGRAGRGNKIENALYSKPFVVLIDGEMVYGGIFLYALSQMAILYPVIRVGIEDSKATFAMLPIHIPFVLFDPVNGEETPEELNFTNEFKEAQWLDRDGFLTEWTLNVATNNLANEFREQIRDEDIKSIFDAAGKLRE